MLTPVTALNVEVEFSLDLMEVEKLDRLASVKKGETHGVAGEQGGHPARVSALRGGTLTWLPAGSDKLRGGGSNERRPVDLRGEPEQMFLSFSRGEHTLEFRMAVDDAGESE